MITEGIYSSFLQLMFSRDYIECQECTRLFRASRMNATWLQQYKSLIKQRSQTCKRSQGQRTWIRGRTREYSCPSREGAKENNWLMVEPLQSEESKQVKEHMFRGLIGVCGAGINTIWVGKWEKVLPERQHSMETGLGISQQVMESH